MKTEVQVLSKIVDVSKTDSTRRFEQTLDLNLFIDKKSKKVLKLSKLDVLLDEAVNTVWYVTNSTNTELPLAEVISPKEFTTKLEQFTSAALNPKLLRVLVDPLVVVSFLKTTSKALSKNKIKPIVAKLDNLGTQVKDLSMTKTFKLSGQNLQLKIGKLSESTDVLSKKIVEITESVSKSLTEDYSVGKGVLKTTMGRPHYLEK